MPFSPLTFSLSDLFFSSLHYQMPIPGGIRINGVKLYLSSSFSLHPLNGITSSTYHHSYILLLNGNVAGSLERTLVLVEVASTAATITTTTLVATEVVAIVELRVEIMRV